MVMIILSLHEPRQNSHKFIAHDYLLYVAMAKRLRFFLPDSDPAWPASFYTAAAAETGLDIIVGASNDPVQDVGLEVELPEGVRNVGLLEQRDFITTIGESKVLIGVGMPAT